MLLQRKIFSLILIIAVVSFLGFLTENIWIALTKGFMDNRNMIFPFLIGYGLAVIALYLIFGTPQEPRFLHIALTFSRPIYGTLYYLLAIAFCISIGEILLGTLVEKACRIEWWNYTDLPLHIGKYTSVPTSLGFSSLITVFMRFVFIPLLRLFEGMNYYLLAILAVSLLLIMVTDFLHSAFYMYKTKSLMQKWRINTTTTKAYRLLH